MIVLPDRISKLIEQIEAGRPVVQQDLDRLAQLQTLDLARIGEDFARAHIAADDAISQALSEL